MPVRTHGGTSQQPVRYLFVDAGHLRANFSDVISRWCGRHLELNVASLPGLFAATKMFYYDSIDDLSRPGETISELESRIRVQEVALREINSIYNTHVRYGSITGRDRRKRRQKEVDILIAVDMMNHAIRQNMDHAVLLTGDRDFTPLVETLVQFGLMVHVAGDFRSTSDVLREAADHFRPLALNDYLHLVDPAERANLPTLPEMIGRPANQAPPTRVAAGTVGQDNGELFEPRPDWYVLELADRRNARHVDVTGREALEKLALFFELQFGDVSWLRNFIAARYPERTVNPSA